MKSKSKQIKTKKTKKLLSMSKIREMRQEEKKIKQKKHQEEHAITIEKNIDLHDDNNKDDAVVVDLLLISDSEEEKRKEEKLDPTYVEELEEEVEETKDVLPEIVIALEDAGLLLYLTSASAGSMKLSCANENVRKTSIFLAWTFSFHHSREDEVKQLSSTTCFPWWMELLTERYDLLGSFITIHLERNKGYRGSTMNNYIFDIQKSAQWFVFFRKDRLVDNYVDPNRFTTFKMVVAGIKKNINLTIRKEKTTSTSHTLESMVYEHKLPVNGIKELQNAIKEDLPFAESLADKMNASTIDKSMYNRFLGIFFSSMYCFCVQGRISGQ
jgi:hypothetical protein